MSKAKPQITKVCGACHEDFTTHKAKATRCQPCITEGRRVTYRRCFECDANFMLLDSSHVNCSKCADANGLDQSELTPEQFERYRERDKLEAFIEKRDKLLGWLTARDKVRSANEGIHSHHHQHQYDLATLGLL